MPKRWIFSEILHGSFGVIAGSTLISGSLALTPLRGVAFSMGACGIGFVGYGCYNFSQAARAADELVQHVSKGATGLNSERTT